MKKGTLKGFLQSDPGPAEEGPSTPPLDYDRDVSFLSDTNEANEQASFNNFCDNETDVSSPLATASPMPSPWALSLPRSPLPEFNSRACIATMRRHNGHVSAITISPSGVLYTGSDSKNIRAWASLGLQDLGCFGSGSGSVKAILVTASAVFTGHQDCKIRIWSCRPGHRHQRLRTLPTALDRFRRALIPKNYVYVRRHQQHLWINHVDCISCLGFHAGRGLLYSGSWDKSVKVWRLRDWKCVESISAHNDAVNSLVVSSAGTLFTASTDGTIKVWVSEGGSRGHRLKRVLRAEKPSAVNALALSPDENFLYSGYSSGEVYVWRRDVEETVKLYDVLMAHSMAVLCLTAIGNLVLSGSADKTIAAWRKDKEGMHSCVAVLRGHSAPVKCIAASLNAESSGYLVYSGGLDRCVKLWLVDENDGNEGLLSSPQGYSPVLPVLSPAWVRHKIEP